MTIIDVMKCTDDFGFRKRCSGLKKSVTLSLKQKCFFRPAFSFLSGSDIYFRTTVAGSPVDFIFLNLQFSPATVSIFVLDTLLGGRTPGWLLRLMQSRLAGRPPFICHHLTEYIMTITNHIRHIQNLAGVVIDHVDDREYEKAHSTLVDIENRTRLAHHHIDHLQLKADCAARPAGGD